MFLVSSGTCVIGMKYLYVDRAKKFFSKMLRFQHQGYQMKALLKVDEEYQISDISTAWISPFFHLKSKIVFLSLVKRTINLVFFFFFSNFFKFFKNEMDWGSKIKEIFFSPLFQPSNSLKNSFFLPVSRQNER